MACSCKRAKKFEEEVGVPQEENIVMKINRYLFKLFFFAITIVLAIIITPYIIFYAIYAVIFGDNKITLPKFLRKYMQ